jgi:hypothetical protein
MLAARQQDPERLADDYRDIASLVLTIDGLQPEKGHETLYVVRELRRKRVWFAEPLLLCEFARKKENPSLKRYIAPPSALSVMYFPLCTDLGSGCLSNDRKLLS